MSPPRLVIIDDDPSARDSIAAHFRRRGFDVQTADDGPSGVECIISIQPDLVITDGNLPGFHGREIVQRIHARPEFGTLPFIAVSNVADAPGVRQKWLQAGVRHAFAKPVDLSELERVVRALLP